MTFCPWSTQPQLRDFDVVVKMDAQAMVVVNGDTFSLRKHNIHPTVKHHGYARPNTVESGKVRSRGLSVVLYTQNGDECDGNSHWEGL